MIVSPDHHLYTTEGVYHWTPERVKAAWATAGEQFHRALSWPVKPSKVVLLAGLPGAGKSTWLSDQADEDVLYFDATFAEARWRKPWIEAARDAGIPVEIVWVDTPLDVCIERQSFRSEDRRVPIKTLRSMHHRITSSPPSEDEGATITVVSGHREIT